ncbi:hypothetical protein [Emcibacter nanhaiensis]|uniref:Lipoprotein n=1 Tax=Emcibacter nanhaiensis TaxID=1505037 RepID=A0A501PMY5_9PROT|nr:hypothetical protein [Emcibacter nanhaiensis]TPD61472.1 hypothetical protein FIV46_04495 [Emcibacter nanhaiensis]
MRIFNSKKIGIYKRVIWTLSCCLLVSTCTSIASKDAEEESTARPKIPILGQYIQIKSYRLENELPVRINFSIKNSSMRTICLYRSLFESNHTFLYDLLVRRSAGELLPKNPIGYIDEMPPSLLALKPGEVRTGSLIVGRYSSLGYRDSLQANFRVFGQYCEHDVEYMEKPEFIIESGWFDLKDPEQ